MLIYTNRLHYMEKNFCDEFDEHSTDAFFLNKVKV